LTVDLRGNGEYAGAVPDQDRVANSDLHCLTLLLEGLGEQDGLPELRPLVERLVNGCLAHLAVSGVGVGLPVPGVGQLEPGWDGGTGNCFLNGRTWQRGLWCSLPGSWEMAARSSGVRGGSGQGLWPAAWPLEDTLAAPRWQQLVLGLQEQPVLLLLVIHEDDWGLARKVESSLRQLQSALTPLLQIWARARRLDADLGRARTENQALSRLNALQERVVAMASHEFKTPLTSIMAYTDALRGKVTDEAFPHATEFLGIIRTEAGRLLRMANRILDFSGHGLGSEMLEVEDQDLEPLVSETVLALKPALSAKGLRLDTTYHEDTSRARVDADLVRQVLVNLLSNAIKYTPRGGTISVTVSEGSAGVRIRVADTGLGIPGEDLQRIFREFYRTSGPAAREEGTGLGLTIVRNIMNLHEGHVQVARRSEGGTVFTCDLPKEVREMAPLPLEFSRRADRDRAWRLVRLLLYMVAELTDSPSVVLDLRDGRGGLSAVAAMGPAMAMATDTGEGWVAADMAHAGQKLGRWRICRGQGGEDYTSEQVLQLGIIADVAGLAVSYLTSGGPVAESSSINQLISKVSEAVRAVIQIRRSGIPTSTAQALDLVDRLGRELGIGAENIRRLQHASLLHDAGMARVESEIVLGESALSWDQRDEVERHVEQGLDLMAPLLVDEDMQMVIKHHHERVDGEGYPGGLAGCRIPLGARLLAVIDAWFALTRTRTYRHSLAPLEALAEIQQHAGTQFDTQVVEAFASVLREEGIVPGSPPSDQPLNSSPTPGE
jgi:signal transduction histidine kinase